MADSKAPISRPLSPHLQIYKFMFTMVMSILHRMTGAALYAGTLLLAWYLVALATGQEGFSFTNWFFASWFGRLILFGYTWALFHHMLGGLRHFVWDTGRGFDPVWRERLAQLTLIGSIVLTLVVWLIAYSVR
jgi:succinate dehydrogenase / fumarate reductase, cytochrome b subunit